MAFLWHKSSPKEHQHHTHMHKQIYSISSVQWGLWAGLKTKEKICEQTTSCTLREKYLFPVQLFQIAQKLNAVVNNSVEHIIYMFTLLQKIHVFTLVSLTFY